MNWNDITIEECKIYEIFHELLEEIGYGWAYALGESPREWVACLYKSNGLWHEYIIEDGHRTELYKEGMDLYDLCYSNLQQAGGNDYGKTNYLLNAFVNETALLRNVYKKR